MTDLHTHILSGVDDGALIPEESSHMLELAAADGTLAMVATPHSDLRYRFEPQRCRELLDELQDRHPGGPRLYLGCELHLTRENIASAIDNPRLYALNGGDCILLELPGRFAPPIVDPAIERLIQSGLRVIVAHPERNLYIQHQVSYVERLVGMGCFLQLTARSLTGAFGPAAASAANHILKRRLAHFIASDAHGVSVRKPILSGAFDNISKSYGEPAARALFMENPEAALSGSAFRQMPAAPRWTASIF
jgi:protein-tyrosine phosphatase